MSATTRYEVKSGDWLAKIAEEHGTTVGAIWNHPQNAAHRAKRGSPDVLYPGDILFIPVSTPSVARPPEVVPPTGPPSTPPVLPPELPPWPFPPPKLPNASPLPTWSGSGACACHPISADVEPSSHTIVFHDPYGARMPGARCMIYERGRALTSDGAAADGLGELTLELAPTTQSLVVQWADPAFAQPMPYEKRYQVNLDEHPIQSRLSNLGFSANRSLADNVRDYQRAHGREPSGLEHDIYDDLCGRHDDGLLTPFERRPTPHEPPATGDETLSSFFERPEQVQGLSLAGGTLMGFADGKAKTATGGGKSSGADAQGAVVPDVGHLLLVVGLEPAGGPLKVDDLTVRLLPRVVPHLPPEEQRTLVEPTHVGVTWDGLPATYAAFFFENVRMGSYAAIAHLGSLKEVSRRYALGHVDVTIKVGLGTLGYLPLLRERPILTVNDPLLELDVDVMQRRRKVLATVFEFLPQSASAATAPKHMPPYQQGAYKDMLPGLDQTNTCAPINVMLMSRAGAIGPSFGFKQVIVKNNGGQWTQHVPAAFTQHEPGRAPSVGDSFLMVDEAGFFHHCGVIVRSSPRIDDLWLTADGGQPDRTSPFQAKNGVWRRYYEPPPAREGAYIVARTYHRDDKGHHRLGNRFLAPSNPRPHGDIIRGWTDVTHPTVMFNAGYSAEVTENDFRGCQKRVTAVYQRVLKDIEQAVAEELYGEL